MPHHRHPELLPHGVSFALGAVLSVSCLDLLPSAFEKAGIARAGSLSATVLVGLLGFFLLEKLLLWRHSHDEHDLEEQLGPGHDHGRSGALIVVGDTIHNFLDGILIAAAFLQSTQLGIVTAIAIVAHEIPQEVGDFLILLHSGYSKTKAFVLNMLSSCATLVGGVLGYHALQVVQDWTQVLLGIVAVSMIYVAVGVMLPERHSAGLSETVAHASAGAIEHVRVARVGNLVQALQALKARGIWVVGFDATGSERWDAVDLTKPVALVLSGEGRGIRRLVREHCDHLVSIPQFGHIGSLNVSVAAGIALYEVVRQRRSVPSGVRPIPARPQSSQIVGPAADDAETDPGARPVPPLIGDDGSSDVAAASVRHV